MELRINILQQFCSSLPSSQSLKPLHICLTSTHCSDISHLNCSARHSQNTSSEPSAQLLSPSQIRPRLIHSPFAHKKLLEWHLYSRNKEDFKKILSVPRVGSDNSEHKQAKLNL